MDVHSIFYQFDQKFISKNSFCKQLFETHTASVMFLIDMFLIKKRVH